MDALLDPFYELGLLSLDNPVDTYVKSSPMWSLHIWFVPVKVICQRICFVLKMVEVSGSASTGAVIGLVSECPRQVTVADWVRAKLMIINHTLLVKAYS